MNLFEEIKSILREKSGKKLAALSVSIFLIITVIVFFAVYKLCENIYLKQMSDYLGSIPGIIQTSRNELLMRSRIYEDDILTRAELGLKIYTEENGQADAENLERVRDRISADSVSLVDAQRQLLSTTGAVSPEENFRAGVQALEPRALHLEMYPIGEDTEKKDGKGFVMLPVPGDAEHSLVFEFSCDAILEIYSALDDWAGMLKRLLSSEDTTAYAKTGDRLTTYPVAELAPEQASMLLEELTKLFESSDSFRSTENGELTKLITLQGKRYLAVMMSYPQEDTDLLLTGRLKEVLGNGIYIALSISAIIGWGIVLIQIYVFRRLRREKAGKGRGAVSLAWVCRATWPGILMAVVVTAFFSTMLLLLENRSNNAFFGMNNRIALQYEIDWRKDQEDLIRNTFVDSYRTRTQTLAAFLTDHPESQTRAGLEELSRIAGADYLMRLDKTGQQLFSSNSYTGFFVGDNLSEEYQAVLMGYPYAVVGPEADRYTGQMQLGTAAMMTDGEGQPDGFLLAVYSAKDLTAELDRMKLENTVNNYIVRKGHIVAAINDEDGRFISHTDPQMIGLKAKDYLENVEPGSSFEGFTRYNRQSVYVSARATEGKTLLFVVPELGDAYAERITLLMLLSVLAILVLVYYPTATVLSAKALEGAQRKLAPSDRVKNPLTAFLNGYVIFLTLFALLALIFSSNRWWTSFDYVFSGKWSKGFHLFSIWAALFILVVTLFVEYLIRTVLRLLESRLSLRAKTITRLASSLTLYIAIIFLSFCILDVFGVNTKALMASAGIISIAVGMGAQSMAADLLAGFFMMLEGSVHVGDQVKVADITGQVTDMGIRTMEITDKDGNVVIINNSKITGSNNSKVVGLCNMSRKSAAQDAEDEPKKEA